MSESKQIVISFISYKGGSGRTSAVVNTALGLAIQGQHVLLIDFDLEAPGLPIFSSVSVPDPLLQPEHLYQLPGLTKPVAEPVPDGDAPNDKLVELKGWISCLPVEGNDPRDELDKKLDGLPIYEYRSPHRHPLEGRVFLLPIGGSYRWVKPKTQAETLLKATNWTYFPPVEKELKTLLKLQRSEWIFSDRANFSERLVDKAVDAIRKIGINLGYVLIDQRPGISLRSLASFGVSNRVVLVATGSRGNMAGVRDLIERFTTFLEKPAICGVLCSPLLPAVRDDHDTAQADPRASLRRNAEQVELDGPMRKLEDKHPLPEVQQLKSRLALARESYEMPNSSFWTKAKEMTPDDYFWGRAWSKSEKYLNRIIPFLHDRTQYVYDRGLWVRTYARTRGSDNRNSVTGEEQLNVEGILLLAGHFRSLNENDLAYRTWSLLLREDTKHQRVKHFEWTPLTSDRSPWRCFWHKALWLEMRGEYKDALDCVKQARERQEKEVRKIPGLKVKDWPGDWRLFLLTARLQRAMIDSDPKAYPTYPAEAVESFRSALKSLDYEREVFQTGTPDQASVDPVAAIRAVIRQEFAQFLAKQDHATREDINEAMDLYNQVLEDRGAATPELLSDLLTFFERNQSRLANLDDCFRNLESQLVQLTKRHDSRAMLIVSLVSLARLRLARYWENPDGADRRLLLDAINALQDTEELRSEGNVAADALGPGLLGAALLEAASQELGRSQYQYVLQSIEQFENATQQDLRSFNYHLYLAVSRTLRYLNSASPYSIVDEDHHYTSQEPDSRKIGNEVRIRRRDEHNIGMRDAFYAFEQALALEANPERPEFYFTSDAAEKLMEVLPTAIRVLLEIHGESNISRRIGRWLDRLLEHQDRESHSDALALVENMLSEAGLKRSRNEEHAADKQRRLRDRLDRK